MDVEPISSHQFWVDSIGPAASSLKHWQEQFQNSPSPDTELQIAHALYQLNRDDEAVEHYLSALPYFNFDDKRLFEAHKNLGNIFLRKGELESAEEHYNRANTIKPDSDSLLTNFGTLEVQRSQWSEAKDCFREALSLNPKNDKAWIGLALVHRQLADFELAWANLERALDIEPYNKTGLTMLVEWSVQDHRLDRGLFRLEEYLKVHLTDMDMSFVYARLFYIKGQYRSSYNEVSKILTLFPQHSDARKLLTVVEFELNNRGESV